MLRNKNIAFFIDVDNVGLTSENYDNILAQLESMGNILTGKIYGAKERKHKGIFQSAEVKGYKVERPMRIKRRGRKDFDSRIFVDVVDTVCKAPSIDAVCIVTASCDLVYLYSYLHGKGIKIVGSEEGEEASAAMVDEFVDLGRVYEIKLKPTAKVKKAVVAKTPIKPAVKTSVKPKAEENDDKTDELLREIERLRSLADARQAEKEAQSNAYAEAKRKAEEDARAREEEHNRAKEKAIAEARAKAYEEARIEAEKETLAKIKAEEEKRAKVKAEEEAKARAKAEEEAKAKAKAEAEAKAKEEERAKTQKAIEEAKAKAYEEAKARAYEEARQEAMKEAEARRKAEAEAIAKAEEEAKAKEKALREAEARAEALNKKLEELESKRKEEVRAKNIENADELKREIEQLRRLASETNQIVKEMKEEPKEQPVILRYEVAEKKAVADKPTEKTEAEPAVTTAQEPSKDDNTEQLMREIEHWKSLAESQPKETPAPEDTQSSVRTYYVPQSDSTLIRKIEEIHNNTEADESDELLDEIRKLLEGLD
ncbi:MAG: NYN domain-containing protein [Corallococcus sp.]|nr:NYN domain-containing protein [Corallococcus sp.]